MSGGQRFSAYFGNAVGAITISGNLIGTSGADDGDNTTAANLTASEGTALGYNSTLSAPALGYGGGKPLFYRYVATASGTLTVTTSAGPGSPDNTDTILVAFTDPNLTSPSSIIVSNDDFSGFYSRIVFSVSAGTTYYIAVDGYNPGNGDANSPGWDPSTAHVGSFTLTWSFV